LPFEHSADLGSLLPELVADQFSGQAWIVAVCRHHAEVVSAGRREDGQYEACGDQPPESLADERQQTRHVGLVDDGPHRFVQDLELP